MMQETIQCPYCAHQVPRGAHACEGCQAEVKYGLPIKRTIVFYFISLIVISLALEVSAESLFSMAGVPRENLSAAIAISGLVTVIVHGIFYTLFMMWRYSGRARFVRKQG